MQWHKLIYWIVTNLPTIWKAVKTMLTNSQVSQSQMGVMASPAPLILQSPEEPPSTKTSPEEHYAKNKIQPWDYTIANDLDYFQGTIVKYITRWKDKNGVDDLVKARNFLDKYIDAVQSKSNG